MVIFWIKFLHSVILWIVSVSVGYLLYSGITNHLNTWTWVALMLVLLNSAILLVSGWKCPLSAWAERHGAAEGSVAQIFLPRWFADRLFPICGLFIAAACFIIGFRLLAN